VVQATEQRNGDDGSSARGFYLHGVRGIPIRRELRPGPVVVADVLPEDPEKVPLIQDDEVVEAADNIASG